MEYSDHLKEKQALIALSRARGTSCPADLSHLDWTWMVKAAFAHGLVPLLSYFFISDKQRLTLLPTALHQQLRYFHRINLLQHEYHSRIIPALLKHLQEEKIKTLVLKGPTLTGLYPEPYLRCFGDLDIFVSEENLARTKSIVHALGYGGASDSPEPPISDIVGHLGGYAKLGSDDKPLCGLGTFCVEIHSPHHVSLGPLGLIDAAEWLDNSRPMTLYGLPSLALSYEYELFHLCIHLFRHYSGDWRSLRLLLDIYLVIQRGLDWSAFLTLVRRHQAAGEKAMAWIESELQKNWRPEYEWFLTGDITDIIHYALACVNEVYGPIVPADVLTATTPPGTKGLNVLVSGSGDIAHLWKIPYRNRILDFPDTARLLPELLRLGIVEPWLVIPEFPLWEENEAVKARWRNAPRFRP